LANHQWHVTAPTIGGANDIKGLEGIPGSQDLMVPVLINHKFNFMLWHAEDLARDPVASDTVIADVKRQIDRYNQLRNDAIEALDQVIASQARAKGAYPNKDVPHNTETPGATIDRLSILALRIYHYSERLVYPAPKVYEAYKICMLQHNRLCESLDQLLGDIYAGRKQHVPFRQLKMYNDPELNPVLVAHKESGC